MLVTIVRVSETTRRVEYKPTEMTKIEKQDIINQYGRCETGEIIYAKVDGKLKLELHYDRQYNEYREYTANY